MTTELGKWLIAGGAVLLVAGLIIYLFGGKLGWLGNLPGDIRIEKENFRLYFPVTTMILLSIVLSILLSVFSRLFGD